MYYFLYNWAIQRKPSEIRYFLTHHGWLIHQWHLVCLSGSCPYPINTNHILVKKGWIKEFQLSSFSFFCLMKIAGVHQTFATEVMHDARSVTCRGVLPMLGGMYTPYHLNTSLSPYRGGQTPYYLNTSLSPPLSDIYLFGCHSNMTSTQWPLPPKAVCRMSFSHQ